MLKETPLSFKQYLYDQYTRDPYLRGLVDAFNEDADGLRAWHFNFIDQLPTLRAFYYAKDPLNSKPILDARLAEFALDCLFGIKKVYLQNIMQTNGYDISAYDSIEKEQRYDGAPKAIDTATHLDKVFEWFYWAGEYSYKLSYGKVSGVGKTFVSIPRLIERIARFICKSSQEELEPYLVDVEEVLTYDVIRVDFIAPKNRLPKSATSKEAVKISLDFGTKDWVDFPKINREQVVLLFLMGNLGLLNLPVDREFNWVLT